MDSIKPNPSIHLHSTVPATDTAVTTAADSAYLAILHVMINRALTFSGLGNLT